MKDQREDGMKVYSPDIKPYSMEGLSGIFGTLLSFIIAPIRITTRVMHMIFILPADLQEEYANALLKTSVVLAVIGVVDLILWKRWPLFVSQIPAIYYAYRLRKQARKSTMVSQEKREVDIDFDQVEELCNTIYDDLDQIVKD